MDLAAIRHIIFGGMPPEAFDVTVEVFPCPETEAEDSEQEGSRSTGGSHGSVEKAA